MWSLFTTMCICIYLLLEYLAVALANEIIPELVPNDSSLFSAIHNSQEIIKNLVNNSVIKIPNNIYYIHPIYCKNLYNTVL